MQLGISVASEKDITDAMLQTFDVFVLEDEMKPARLFGKHATEQRHTETNPFIEAAYVFDIKNTPLDMRKVKSFLDFLRKHNKKTFWHCLFWENSYVDGFFYESKGQARLPKDMVKNIQLFMEKVVSWVVDNGYEDLFLFIDLYNELSSETIPYPTALSEMECSMLIRRSAFHPVFYDRLYSSEIKDFFIATAKKMKQLTKIPLAISDYNDNYTPKVAVMLEIADRINGDERLIDYINFQGHFHCNEGLEQEQLRESLKMVTDRGFIPQYTEVDITAATNYLNDTCYHQAHLYNLFADTVTEFGTGLVVFWGTNDALSWRCFDKPTLYDRNGNPKIFTHTVLEKLRGEYE